MSFSNLPAKPNLMFEESNQERLKRKVKTDPLFPIGMTGFFAIVGYGIYSIKNRNKKLPLSMHIIHTRVYAQCFAVGCLALGATYTLGERLYNRYYLKKPYRPED